MSFDLPKILERKRTRPGQLAARHVTGFCAKYFHTRWNHS